MLHCALSSFMQDEPTSGLSSADAMLMIAQVRSRMLIHADMPARLPSRTCSSLPCPNTKPGPYTKQPHVVCVCVCVCDMRTSQVRRAAEELHMGVLLTIHQPRQEIYDMFDRVILMAAGTTVFVGSPSQSRAFFASPSLLDLPPDQHACVTADVISDLLYIASSKGGDHVAAGVCPCAHVPAALVRGVSLHAPGCVCVCVCVCVWRRGSQLAFHTMHYVVLAVWGVCVLHIRAWCDVCCAHQQAATCPRPPQASRVQKRLLTTGISSLRRHCTGG